MSKAGRSGEPVVKKRPLHAFVESDDEIEPRSESRRKIATPHGKLNRNASRGSDRSPELDGYFFTKSAQSTPPTSVESSPKGSKTSESCYPKPIAEQQHTRPSDVSLAALKAQKEAMEAAANDLREKYEAALKAQKTTNIAPKPNAEAIQIEEDMQALRWLTHDHERNRPPKPPFTSLDPTRDNSWKRLVDHLDAALRAGIRRSNPEDYKECRRKLRDVFVEYAVDGEAYEIWISEVVTRNRGMFVRMRELWEKYDKDAFAE
ncbi:hypothetical protein MMC25_000570 [Agyrium rufum]|nr:hypothetical protein [Agyrium rufum]